MFENPLVLIALIFLVLIGLVIAAVFVRYFNLWIQSKASGAGIGLIHLIGMKLRNVNPDTIVRARVMSVQAKLKVSREELEAHYLAGGNVPRVMRALISASRADIPMDFRHACIIDLAGGDYLRVDDAIQTSVNPKIIDVPDPSKGKDWIEAVAKDGIQLKVRVRVTVRTNIDQLIGGATQETVIARVGEGIVSTIGASESYKDVLEHPDRISQKVLRSGLDAGTSFEILSVDIANIEVGENVGARLQADQAEADSRKARANAEIRRAQAVAMEQVNRALVQENRAKVVLAESEVPNAIARAFRTGQFHQMSNTNGPPSTGNGQG
jgi:uncharacterized protein YqfA (UPF0365 family)